MGNGRFPRGHMAALAVWLAIFAGVYAFMDARLKPTVATLSPAGQARGEIEIPRSRDGHYYVQGSINGQPLVFMVDTGASMVSVGAASARAAGLPRGAPGEFVTAGGNVRGEIVPNQTVEAGGIRVGPLSVAVGVGGDVALLGQNFLRHVDVLQSGDRMLLRLRSAPQ
jgi:aspartyl protease family protein